MERLRAFWNKGWMGKAVLGVAALLSICCVASAIVAALSPGTTPTVQAPAATSAPATQATAAPASTSAPEPTAAIAPTDAPEPTAAAPSIAKVGDRVESNGIALTVIKVDKTDKIGDFQKAQAGNILIVAEVVIENVDASAGDYNPFYFKVKDAGGFEYTATINTDTQGLKAGTLAKGEKARGTVAIEVKESAKGLILSYAPIALSFSGEPIRVALE